MATPHSDQSCEAISILTDVASCPRPWPPGALGIPSRLLTTLYILMNTARRPVKDSNAASRDPPVHTRKPGWPGGGERNLDALACPGRQGCQGCQGCQGAVAYRIPKEPPPPPPAVSLHRYKTGTGSSIKRRNTRVLLPDCLFSRMKGNSSIHHSQINRPSLSAHPPPLKAS